MRIKYRILREFAVKQTAMKDAEGQRETWSIMATVPTPEVNLVLGFYFAREEK